MAHVSPNAILSPRDVETQRWRRLRLLTAAYVAAIVMCNILIARSPLPQQSDSAGQLNNSTAIRPQLFAKPLPLPAVRSAAAVIDPSLFNADSPLALVGDNTEPPWNSTFKNPCWNDGAKLRCVPYFYVLGAFQCGVRDLGRKMVRHPAIAQSANPEIHFWSELREAKQLTANARPALPKILHDADEAIIGCAQLPA